MSHVIQFATVREDPIVEQAIINKLSPKKVLMVGSGGCTALSLKMLFPTISFTLFDLNPKQIELVQHKILTLKNSNENEIIYLFNIENDNPLGLNACGKFESLFRSFRNFLHEFVLSSVMLKDIFLETNLDKVHFLKTSLYSNKYWPIAFDLYFSDSLLVGIFGKAAIQHAEPGSYPRYFQKQIERGLNRADAQTNYFLHHILLGCYLEQKDCLPLYLQMNKKELDFDFVNSDLLSIANINDFQLIDLSNIFDWMPENEVLFYLNYLNEHLSPESIILFRQLNNTKDYISKIKGLQSDESHENYVLSIDRSLFYNKINIVKKKDI